MIKNFLINIQVLLNLACQYTSSGSYTEALNTYNTIMKQKTFQLSGRLKTNIGNIHFQQKQYLKAIKMYRMALDQIPLTNQDLKYKNLNLSKIATYLNYIPMLMKN